MKKLYLILALVMVCVSFAACKTPVDPGEDEVELDKMNAVVETWEAPASYGRNTDYKVEVSADGTEWKEIAVYVALNGHQLGDPLITRSGTTYFGTPYEASITMFDFTGTVGVRVTYNAGTLEKKGYILSPDSYKLKSNQNGNTVTFTMTQNADSPRKVVFRPEGEWEEKCLQIMTNVPEDTYKIDETGAEVYVVEEGAEIPLYLPDGKSVYYFKKGIHDLPGGYWADIDLGSVKDIKKFDLMTPGIGEWQMPSGVCFEILAKSAESDAYTSVYKSTGESAEDNIDLTGVPLVFSARYVRLVLLGNASGIPTGGYRYVNKSFIKEFRLFDGADTNVALGKAVRGAGKNFALVTDGDIYSGEYGYTYANETFNVRSGYTYYFAKGSVVYGSFMSDGADNVTISGRGIFDGGKLFSEHRFSEGRNGSVHFENCNNVVLEGITVMNAPMWMIVINHSKDVLVSGINLLGYCTNADGIHFSGSENAVATGCYIRTTDDLFVAYHYGEADGLTFKNSVLWSDGGRPLLLGLSNTGNIKNVTMKDCDIITYQNTWDLTMAGGFAQIVASGGKTISNLLIKDIRIDEVRSPSIAVFLQIKTGFGTDGAGFVDGVAVENVSFASKSQPKSLITNVMPGGTISNVSFKNVTIGGEAVSQTNLKTYFNVDPDITVAFK